MLDIKNNVIHITKGDTAVFAVSLNDADGSEYYMVAGDRLIFSARKRIGGDVLVSAESGTNEITLTEESSKRLEVGGCFYDVELRTAAGGVYTVTGPTGSTTPNLIVYPEVTENG